MIHAGFPPRTATLLLSATWLIFAGGVASGQDVTFPERPDIDAGVWFADGAALIAEPERSEINEIASGLWSEERHAIVVATIPSLQSHNAGHFTIERYAAALFDEWGISSEERNTGMLLLVSRGDRKARIELGAYWDHTYDDDAEKVMRTLIIPQFKRDQFSGGILAGVRGMDSMARGLGVPFPKPPWYQIVIVIICLLILVIVIINLFKSGRKGWAWALIIVVGIALFFMLRASARCGGGGFGGGSSGGGGGATGSW